MATPTRDHFLRRLIPPFLVLASAVLPAAPVSAMQDQPAVSQQVTPVLKGAGPGQKVTAPDLASPAELVRFDPSLIPALLAVPVGKTVRVSGWPVAPQQRAEIVLSRYDIYAPDARIFKVEGSFLTEVPRSKHLFFRGSESADPEAGIFVAVDPETLTLEGLSQSRRGAHAIKALVPGKPGLHLLAAAEAFQPAGPKGEKPTWQCGQEEVPSLHPLSEEGAPAIKRSGLAAITASAMRNATVAIDTDNALMLNKFSNNTTAATNYIASLLAAINVMYNRDLQVQLVQGTTFLRVSTTPDPFMASTGGAADGPHLQDFGTYWMNNYSNVSRTVVAMLSGKSPDSFSASGIAYVNALCNTGEVFDTNFFGGYSFSEVFLIDELPLDAIIVGHEIGHNFGSPHTHCYQPPIDTCWNLEACYTGPTACPAPSTIQGQPNVEGTIMSYCHLRSDGCTTSLVFHPRTVSLVEPSIEAAVGVCMSTAAPAVSVSSVSPPHGPAAGGTQITILGSGFQPGATVKVGGVAASVTSVAGGSIVATTGAHATGKVDVTVTNPDASNATGAGGFFYDPAATAAKFFTLTPCRVLDTRNATGPLGGPALTANGNRVFVVSGTCGIPSSARSISANVTVVGPAAAGLLTLFPGNAFAMGTSTISFAAGDTRANNAVIELATDGTGSFGVLNQSTQATPFVVDVNGYFQ